MTRLFRSKSCGVIRNTTSMFDSYPSPTHSRREDYKGQQQHDDDDDDNDNGYAATCPFTTPFITSPERHGKRSHNNQSPILDILAAVLRKSLVTCSSVQREEEVDVSSIDIGWPTDVRHVSHVTFDRFNGFLGLPSELQHEPDLPHKVPSASASVFGVSANSMQCSYDQRGNSVPTILLMMQKCLYSEGGLQAEGIFRIAAENSQEEYVRNQLNKGVVPHGIDVHCLAGLIKAWFRELPAGVLDTLTPEKVMHCHTVEECAQLVKLLPPTEAALLDWAINLMADVVQHENHNKMDARNIAMVFAPNMTQMADPLNALIHAVQVMNFLKTLIVKTLREREESAQSRLLSSHTESPMNMDDSHSSKASWVFSHGQTLDCRIGGGPAESNHLCTSATSEKLECGGMEELWSSESKNDAEMGHESTSGRSTPVMGKMANLENCLRGEQEDGEVEGMFDGPSLKEGMRKLYTHPVFQLSKPVKRSEGLEVVNIGDKVENVGHEMR